MSIIIVKKQFMIISSNYEIIQVQIIDKIYGFITQHIQDHTIYCEQ